MPNEPLVIAAVMVGGYLLGSTPFGVISMKLAGAGDPREIGSGNIGATNVLRSGINFSILSFVIFHPLFATI